MDSIGDESIAAHEHEFKKYGAEGLLASSVGLGWSGLSAELLTHGPGVNEYQGAESGAGRRGGKRIGTAGGKSIVARELATVRRGHGQISGNATDTVESELCPESPRSQVRRC